MASRSSPVPRRRAISAGTGEVKNTQVCAPAPDLDTSSATGTWRARPALTYMRASNMACGPSDSWRSTKIFASLAALLRAGSTSHLNTRTMNK